MYKLPGQEELLYYMLYTAAALLSLIASLYLLLRRGNAFDTTEPPLLCNFLKCLLVLVIL